MNETLFYAKKTVSEDGGWELNIDLIFEGREFSMTDVPVSITRDDIRDLCPGADPDSDGPFTDTIAITGRQQFESVFGCALTDDAQEILCDVYQGRWWAIRTIDTEGNERVAGAYLTEDFIPRASEILKESDRFWMEIRTGRTRFKEDWTVEVEDETTVFCNIRDGFGPIGPSQAGAVIEMLTPMRMFVDSEDFKGTVMKSGNSMVLKVTDQCRRMGLGVGDEVSVTLDANTPKDNTELRVFASRIWTPISDPDAICHRNGCDLAMVRRFLDDFEVIGTVEAGWFKPGWIQNDETGLFDHANFFKTADGTNIIVSQPYSKGSRLKDAEKWASENGCTAEEHRDYSWHYPPDTTLLVFRKRTNPDWKIPQIKNQRGGEQ